jgi:hypothetical protein
VDVQVPHRVQTRGFEVINAQVRRKLVVYIAVASVNAARVKIEGAMEVELRRRVRLIMHPTCRSWC